MVHTTGRASKRATSALVHNEAGDDLRVLVVNHSSHTHSYTVKQLGKDGGRMAQLPIQDLAASSSGSVTFSIVTARDSRIVVRRHPDNFSPGTALVTVLDNEGLWSIPVDPLK